MKTDSVVKQEEINALISKLSCVDAGKIREPFDYTKWREESLDERLDVRRLSKRAMMYAQDVE